MKNALNHPKTFLFCLGCLSALAVAPVYLWPLIVLGYSFLLYFLDKSTGWKQASFYGFLFFFGYFLTSFYWISNSLFVEFERWWWALPFSFVGLPLLLSLFPICCIGIASFFFKYRALIFIFALIIADIARGTMFTGLPWNMPVHGFVNSAFLMENILPHLGFYTSNSLIILICTLPFWALKCKHTTFRVISVATFVAFFMVTIFYPATSVKKPETNGYTITLIQGNIAQKDKWDYDKIWSNFMRYINMSKDVVEGEAPHIVIWPETALSQFLFEDKEMLNGFAQFLSELPKGSFLIAGELTFKNQKPYNSLVIYNTNAEIIASYEKHHLVPFGEYMPFGLDTITGFKGFAAGNEPDVMNIIPGFSFLPLICFESVFPKYSKNKNNADFFVNLTNDAWFGQTAGPYQHFDQMRFRSAESKKPSIRLSGNGVSGMISSDGQIVLSSSLNKQAYISFKD